MSATILSSMPHPAPHDGAATGGRLVTPDGRALPFRGGSLTVDAAGGLARVVLRQRFFNPYSEPLRVTYQVPLPSDAAVSGYAFELGEVRIVGEVDRKAAARERFEEAIFEGRTAALLEQDRSSLFTQEVGNLPPGEEVVCELTLDQLLAWTHASGQPAGWSWRFPTVVAPRFMGAPGRVPDARRVSVDVAEQGTPATMDLHLVVRDPRTGAIHSPSHSLHCVGDEVGLGAEGGVALDRDIVVRWPVAKPTPGVSLDFARAGRTRGISDHACGLLTIVPPASTAIPVLRDLVVLLDTSGSMRGEPLAQAVAVTVALVRSLNDGDQLQIVEFSTRPRAWREQPVAATNSNREAAIKWLQALRAGGGTQMKAGILDALSRLRDEAQRQVVLVTDGLIGFEQEIVGAVMSGLPRGCRVHTLGIGSSVNRSLLTPVARAGGGIEAIVGLGEDPLEAARALVSATASPLVVDLELSGDAVLEVAHHRAPDLMGNRPSRIALRLNPLGGTLVLTGHTAQGPWQHRMTVPPVAPDQGSGAIVTLVGRERVAEAELRAAIGEDTRTEVEGLGLAYQIATSQTSWVAISQHLTVDPTRPTRRETVPQALPHGMGVEGLGLRPAMPPAPMMQSAPAPQAMMAEFPKRKRSAAGLRSKVEDHFGGASSEMAPPSAGAAPTGAPPPAESAAESAADEPMPTGISERDFNDELDALSSAGGTADAPTDPWAHRWHDVRIVLAKGDRLVLELDVDSLSVVWRLPRRQVRVLLRDGRELIVTLDTKTSTAKGWIQQGEVLRIVLDGPGLGSLSADIAEVIVDADTTGLLRLHLRPTP